jgi:hypothetical protein
MHTIESAQPFGGTAPDFAGRLRAAIAVLVAIVDDRGLLAGVTPAVRRRLMQAAAQVYHPDHVARRGLVK